MFKELQVLMNIIIVNNRRNEGMLKFMESAKSKLQIQIDTVNTAEQNKEILDTLKNTNSVLDDLTKIDYSTTVKEFLKKNAELANQMEVLNEVEVDLNMTDEDTNTLFIQFMQDNNPENVDVSRLNNIIPKEVEQQPPQATEVKKEEVKERELEIEY